MIIAHFEPWNFSNTDQLLSQFFIRLSNEFKKRGDKNLEKIGEALEKYSNAFELIDIIPSLGGLGVSLAVLARLTGKRLNKDTYEKDISKQKENVVELLEKQSNRILIVIDDIDRLNNEQIRNVFQLITSVAKFPNTTYLLAFDKQIVVKALEEVQMGDGETYLEKIIQIPIQLPEIRKSELRRLLFDKLDIIIRSYPNISFEKGYWQKIFKFCVDPFIKNLRDVNRLCNTLQFKLGSIHSEVDFTDMVAITSIEIGLPSVYEWIRDNKSILTGDQDYSLTTIDKKDTKECLEDYQTQIRFLLQNGNGGKVVENDAAIALKALSILFPVFGHKIGQSYETIDRERYRKNNQIAHPEKFDRYFQLNVDEIIIKKSDLQKAVYLLSEDDFIVFLLEQDKKGISYEFLEEVRAWTADLPVSRIKVIIKALLRSSKKLDVISHKNIFSTSASDYADHMLIELLSRLLPEERYMFIEEILKNADIETLQTLTILINLFELGEGRLAAKGQKYFEYKDVIQLEELIELEKEFCNKVKEVLEYNNLFDFREWKMIVYLIENFEPEYIKAYFAKVFEENSNILKYLDDSIVHWVGSGDCYEIREKYKVYLTKERIIGAIKCLVGNRTFFDFPEEIQNKCAAFYLHSNGEVENDGYVYQDMIVRLLNIWKKEKMI